MYKNILFLTIDGLRADKLYGKFKTSKTPFLDSLIEKGTYFEKSISSHHRFSIYPHVGFLPDIYIYMYFE